MPGCTLFLAIGIGLLVVAVDVEHAVPYSAVNETEDGDRVQHQHDRVRPSIADAQHVIGVHSHRYADQDCRYTAHDADHQQTRLAWMTALQMERFEQKATLLNERLKRCQGNWEDAFFITLARNFGFGLNGDAFETWAHRLPFRAVDKHRNDLFQIEAIFFGQAGILEDSDGDGYYLRLKKEYTYLQHKFGLIPMDASLWRFLRLRPANFPHIRIAQLACLYHRAYGLLSRIMETETLQGVRDILKGGTSEYWLTHYTFGGSSPSRPKTLSNTSLDLLIINTVVTFLYAYGLHKGNRVLCARAGSFLEELKAENNYITRMWEQCGMKASNAADSQALIQLKKEYCDKKKCLYCRIGYEYLKRS